MGFFIRKRKRFGPLSLNVSKSGLGLSAGVRGARLGIGPSGMWFFGGLKWLFFRKKVSKL